MYNEPVPSTQRLVPRFVLGVGFICAQSSVAQTISSTSSIDTWLDQPTMTGDWSGARTDLESLGISPRAHITSESAGNPLGGEEQTVRSTEQIDFGADIDLQRLLHIPYAKIQLTMTDRFGRSLSADAIGNQFAVQELYGAGQNFRLAELNYQQDFLEHTLAIEVGWSPVGDQFATIGAFCNFQNGIICGHNNAMTDNSGAHNFPTAEWGVRVKWQATPSFYAMSGVYQVNPNEGDANKGWDLSLRGTGVFAPVELGWTTGDGAGQLPGIYKIGAYYNSSATPDLFTDVNGHPAGLTSEPFEEHDGREGGYIMTDQMVYRERADSLRGLSLGATIGLGDTATAKYRYFAMAGGHYQGTFPGRDNDLIAFMFAYAKTNPRLTGYQEDRESVAPGSVGIQTYESIAEVDYGAQIAPWLLLRPNLQYVTNPGGTGKIPNALIIGLTVKATF
jgi:porin